jgi:hypothetical protein
MNAGIQDLISIEPDLLLISMVSPIFTPPFDVLIHQAISLSGFAVVSANPTSNAIVGNFLGQRAGCHDRSACLLRSGVSIRVDPQFVIRQ